MNGVIVGLYFFACGLGHSPKIDWLDTSPQSMEFQHSLIDIQGIEESHEQLKALQFLHKSAQDTLGDSHSTTLVIQHELAVALMGIDPTEGLEYATRGISALEQAQDNSELYRAMLFTQSTLLQNLNRYSEAHQTLLTLVEAQKRLGLRYAGRIKPLETLVDVSMLLARFDDAEQALNTLLRLQRIQKGRNHPDTWNVLSRLGMLYVEKGEYSKGQRILEDSLRQQEGIFGNEHSTVLLTQHHLGYLHRELGETELSLQYLETVLSKRRRILGDDHPDTVASINNLALLYMQMGQTPKAEALFDEALHVLQVHGDMTHPDTISTMSNLAQLYAEEERLVESKELFEQVLEYERSIFESTHPDVILNTQNLSIVYSKLGEYERAERLLRSAIADVENSPLSEHPRRWVLESNLGMVLTQQSKFDEAQVLLGSVLQQQTQGLGASHPQTLSTRLSLANLRMQTGDFDSSALLINEAVELAEEHHSLEHPIYLESLQSRALLKLNQGLDKEAKADFDSILVIQRQTLGDAHFKTVQTMRNIGWLYQSQGQYSRAETLFLQAFEVQKTSMGETHPEVLKTQTALAGLYELQGEYVKSESLMLTVVHSTRGVFGATHPIHLTSMMGLASLYASQGRYTESLDLYRYTSRAFEALAGAQHPYTIQSLNGEASTLVKNGEYETANPILEEVVQHSTVVYGETHPNTFLASGALGSNLQQTGNLEEALPILESVLLQQSKTFGEEHPSVLISKSNLANVYTEMHRTDEARRLLEDVFIAQQTLFGMVHPSTIETMRNQVRLYANLKDVDSVLSVAEQLVAAERQFLSRNSAGSESARRQFYQTFEDTTHMLLTFVLDQAPTHVEAVKFAFEVWTERQGKVLEDQIDMQAVLSKVGSDTVDRLLARRKQLLIQDAELRNTVFAKDVTAQLALIQDELSSIEAEISRDSKAYAEFVGQESTLDVTRHLPNKTLIQYAVLSPQSPNGEEMLSAFVVSEKQVSLVRLGPLAALSEKVQALRQTRSKTLGRDLYRRLVAPLEDALHTEEIYLVPDGILNLLPFELLRDSNGQYWFDSVQLTYLGSTKDLGRFAKSSSLSEIEDGVVIANPNFQDSEWGSLPSTVGEANLLAGLYPKTRLLMADDATLNQVRDLSSPTLLHIATHGFVQRDDPRSDADNNPLIRTGLVLSNTGKGVEYLRSIEAATLDLHETQLVVLSACESGLGEAQNGEGVYGLRRALTIAGAQSQVLSLWPVSDEGTKVFMGHFYEGLASGLSKSVALYQAKEAMRQTPRWSNPVFWGAFVLVGNPI